MASQIEGPVANFTAGEELTVNRLVSLSSGSGTQVVYCDAGMTPIGVVQRTTASGSRVPVRLLNAEGTLKIEAAGAASAGDRAYTAANGTVDDIVTGPAVGIFLAAPSGSGSIVEVLPLAGIDESAGNVVEVTAGVGGISAHQLVYVSDQTDGLMTVLPAQSTSGGKFADYYCPATIAEGAKGVALKFYLRQGINTSAGSQGEPVYLSDDTAGAYDLTKPTVTDKIQIVGRISEDHATTGAILYDLTGPQQITHNHNSDAEGGQLTSPQIVTSIDDTNGLELIKVTATGSAVNEITVANAATGNNPSLTASGDDANVDLVLAGKGTGRAKMTSPKIVTDLSDTNGAELIKVTATGSAVNEITVANAATGGSPTISATGDDAAIDLTLSGKGTGRVKMTSPKIVTDISDTNGLELLKVTATGSAVNEVTLANAATANNPSLTASGDDANIDLVLAGKGTGAARMTSPKIVTDISDTNGLELIKVTATGSAVNEITVANAATGNGPTVSATGDDADVDLNIAAKGTGEINFGPNDATFLDNDGLKYGNVGDTKGHRWMGTIGYPAGHNPGTGMWLACADVAYADPSAIMSFMEDFQTLPLDDTTANPTSWKYTGDDNGEVDIVSGNPGGVVRVGVQNTDNKETYIQLGPSGTEEGFVVTDSNNKPFWFEVRVRANQHADEAVFVGLAEGGSSAANFLTDDTGVPADKDYIGLRYKTDASAEWDIAWKKAGQAEQEIANVKANADDWIRFGFYFDGTSTVTFYVDGVANGTTMDTSAATSPSGEEMNPIIALKTGAAAARSVDVDYIKIVALR